MRLGPFELFQPIASGGMSDVWSAWHVSSGVFAAVKLIPPSRVDPSSRFALEKEIRTMAALDHPGIVWVYDQGTIDAALAEASGGELMEHSPYLVMEYAAHTLRHVIPVRSWGQLRGVLVTLLDALAHAHARGVIHRDIKPGNVLIGGPDDLRPGPKLTDFGIARALDAADPITGARKIVGTPRYMAPEQIDGDWRVLGPGTDLYSLGCLVFRCLHDEGPFTSKGHRLLLDHLRTPAPRLVLPAGFPPELADWTAWLLEKDIGDRPSSAAVALEQLPPGFALPLDLGEPGPVEDQPTVPLSRPPLVTLAPRKGRRRQARTPQGIQLLPIPTEWQRPIEPIGVQLRDAGRALLGLRQIPMAGRIRERDRLWTSLRQCANRSHTTVTLLTAHTGLGRSRLVDWLADRVDELACATPITARLRRELGLVDGLRGVLDTFFRTRELTGPARADQLDLAYSRLGIAPCPLVELALAPDAELQVVQAALLQFTEGLATKGPVVLIFDDIHNQPDVVALVRALRTLTGPVFVVLTVQEEALADDPVLRMDLASLELVEDKLEPLDGEDWGILVNAILPLSPGLAAELENRSKGNPRFAVQLLSDWVQRDVLVLGKDGFEAPSDLRLPPSLTAIWSSRLRHVLGGLPPEAAEVLELAAVLGMEVEHRDLRWLRPENDPLWQGLLARLSLNRLTESTATGFAFAHPALREVILEHARRKGRLESHHAVVALALLDADDPASVRRRGHHRAASGDREGAWEDLSRAAQQARTHQGAATALLLCDEAGRQVGPDDPRAAQVLCLRAEILSTGRNYKASRTVSVQALELASRKGWAIEEARATSHLAVAAYHMGHHDDCRRFCLEVVEQLGDDGPAEVLARAYGHLAWVQVLHGDIPGSVPWFHACEAQFARLDGHSHQVSRLMTRADRANFMEDFDTVEAALDAAWVLATSPPQLLLQILLLERRAFLAARRGNHALAATHCDQLVGYEHALSNGVTARLRLLRGFARIHLSQPAEALEDFLWSSRADHLPQSPLERSMIYAGLLTVHREAGPTAPTENWLRLLEASQKVSVVRHHILDGLLRLALKAALTEDHHQRLTAIQPR